MRREFTRQSAAHSTISANRAAWQRSLNASLRRGQSKAEIQAALAEAARNTAEIQAKLQDEEGAE